MQTSKSVRKKRTARNLYLYNGKELDTDFGLNWYHYGFRMYDPAIGRFTGVDPISDKFPSLSTYNYASNSPIANVDLHGLQAVFFQVAARVGISGSVIPGPTASVSAGVALDTKGNVLVFHTESLGAGFGAFAGAGGEVGVNFGVDDVDGLLGYGANVGAVVGVSPLGGAQFGVEVNASISTEKGKDDILGIPTGEGDNGGGVTGAIPQAGKAVGFFGYVDVSYTSEIKRFKVEDLKNAGQAVTNYISEQYGKLEQEQQNQIIQQIESLRAILDETIDNN